MAYTKTYLVTYLVWGLPTHVQNEQILFLLCQLNSDRCFQHCKCGFVSKFNTMNHTFTTQQWVSKSKAYNFRETLNGPALKAFLDWGNEHYCPIMMNISKKQCSERSKGCGISGKQFTSCNLLSTICYVPKLEI